MTNLLVSFLLIAVVPFTEAYKTGYENALMFFGNHPEVQQQLQQSGLSGTEARIATAIVAPELAVNFAFSDWAQTKTLQLVYVQYGMSDFSIGYFQMKPSFIVYLENRVANDPSVQAEYGDVVIHNTDPEKQRKIRVARLTSLKWQTKYLCLFMHYAKLRKNDFKTNEERLAYWATLYNAGFEVSDETIAALQKKKGFPVLRSQYNFSEVCAIFWEQLKAKGE